MRRTTRYDGGLVQEFDATFPTGPGMVELVDKDGRRLPTVEVPPYRP